MNAVTPPVNVQHFDEVWTALRPHPCTMSPGTTKIFDGRKFFYQWNVTIEICIFDHTMWNQLEVISYDPKKRIELERVYIHVPALMTIMNVDPSTRRKLCNPNTKGSTLAEFVLTRLHSSSSEIHYVPIPGTLLLTHRAYHSIHPPIHPSIHVVIL